MLTVSILPSFVWTGLEIEPVDALGQSVIRDTSFSSYFYMQGGTPSVQGVGSLLFNIDSADMDNIPSSAIIDSVTITMRTRKRNVYSTYDAVNLKYNGLTVANIDATSHERNLIKVATFKTSKLNGSDISKDMLELNFEAEVVTEGMLPMEVFAVELQITYSEIAFTSLCKLNVGPNQLVILPLYNPLSLARYSLRIMTAAGIKAFDLVAIGNPDQSPIRVMTSEGLMAIRQLPIII